MSTPKRTVLITGCSDGGLGAALASAFHEAGLHVYATARNPAKMEQLTSLGIETLTLDVQSQSSIAACVGKLSSLDILVNNAGMQFLMPVVDVSIPEAKKLFDLNVWSHIAMTQAFLPLLLKSPDGMIVNQRSVAAVTTLPFQAVEKAMRQEEFEDRGMPAQKWAKSVVQDLLKKTPPSVIWRGESAWLTRLASVLPFGMFDGMVKKLTGLDIVERTVRK